MDDPLVAIGGGVVSRLRWPAVGWQHLLLWVHRSDFGVDDPLFHRDVGFFVFSLPVYREVTSWLLDTVVMVSLATLVAYALAGGLRIARPLAMVRGARAHVLGLAALVLLVLAWRFRLEQFGLALPHKGAALAGATYVDVRVRLPALQVLSGLSLVGAVLCLYAIARRLPIRLLVPIVAIGALALLGAARLPSLIQRYHVEPQQLTLERPYIERSLIATRHAYALNDVTLVDLDASSTLSAADLADNRHTIDNVPRWDPEIVRAAMKRARDDRQLLQVRRRHRRPLRDRRRSARDDRRCARARPEPTGS